MSLLLQRFGWHRIVSASCATGRHKQLQQLVPATHPWLSSRHQSSATPPADDTTTWRPIYRLPLARWASAVNRLKVYQAIVSALGTPAVFALEQAGELPAQTGFVFAAVGVSGVLTLTLASFGIRNLVGFLYINDVEDKVKISYVDFWGRRKNQVVEIDDMIPAWEHENPTRSIFYQPIQLYSDKRVKFKLLQRFGVVSDSELFAKLFGE